MRKHRASCNRAWVMLYLPAALCLLPGEVSSLRSSGREQRLVFWVFLWPFQQALGWCSSGLWPWPVSQSARCAPAARGPRAGAAVSMAAAILPVVTELLKKQRLEFVLLLASVAPAGSEHVWCGAGELSPTGRGGLSQEPGAQCHVWHELSHAFPGGAGKQTGSGVTSARVAHLHVFEF